MDEEISHLGGAARILRERENPERAGDEEGPQDNEETPAYGSDSTTARARLSISR
jgi:hypothetical protein